MAKLVIKIFISSLAFLIVERTCKKLTDGFALYHIQSDMPYREEWNVSSLSPNEDIKRIFNQPFYYLGRGAQAYAFYSKDGHYVIKFFRLSRMRPTIWQHYLPLPQKMHEKRNLSIQKRQQKLHKDFNSYKIAFEELKEQTALIYLHLNKSHDLNQKLTIYDKLGIEHTLSLDDYEFVLQKRAALIYPTLQKWIHEGKIEIAKQALSDLIDLIAGRCQRGIFDKDPNIQTNFGFIENQPVQFDIGRFSWDISRRDPEIYIREILRIMHPLQTWLSPLSPSLSEHLTKELKQLECVHELGFVDF